jgi:hypothetical protein
MEKREYNQCKAIELRLKAARLDGMPGDIPPMKAKVLRAKADLLDAEFAAERGVQIGFDDIYSTGEQDKAAP